MNLIVLQGRKPQAARLAGAMTLSDLYAVITNYDFEQTDDSAVAFFNGLIESFSFVLNTKDGAKKHEFFNYKGLGFNDIEEVSHALLLIRIAISVFPEDVELKDYNVKDIRFIWQGGLLSAIKKDSNLDKALRQYSSWDLWDDGKERSFYRLALLGLDFAWRTFKGFYVEDGGFMFFDKHIQSAAYLDWFFSRANDDISKEMKKANERFAAANKNAGNTRQTVIETGDKLKEVYDKVVETGGDVSFRLYGTLMSVWAVAPMAIWLGLKPKDKALFWAGVAGAAVPMAVLGNMVKKYPARLETKLMFGGGGAAAGMLGGFMAGRTLKTIAPFAVEAGKTAVSAKSGGLIKL